MIKLVLSDMDGTLLPFGARTVSERTHHAIHAVQEAGIHFGPASGRDRLGLLDAFRGDEKCVSTGILANGKQALLNGRTILQKALPDAAVARLAEALLPFRGTFALLTVPVDEEALTTDAYCLGIAPDDADALAAVESSRQAATVADALPADTHAILGGVYVDLNHTSAEAVRRAVTAACPELEFPQAAPFFLDAIPRGWTKASALPTLLDAMGISLDEVAYVGDSENDLTMLRTIPNSYAVANATTAAKEAARFQIGPSEDDAVAQLLEGLLG